MQKSIFKKYLALTMVTVALGFLMLGAALVTFFSQYIKSEKLELLSHNAKLVASVIEKSGESAYNDGALISIIIGAFSNNIEADIMVVGQEGEIYFGSYANSKKVIGENEEKISNESWKKIEEGVKTKELYEETSTLGGFYKNNMVTVSVPINIKDTNGENVFVGAVLAAVRISPVGAMQLEVLNTFFLAALPTFIITFFLVALFSYNMVKPLKTMGVAVKRFGGGDFSVRVPVNSGDEIGELATAFNEMANSLSNSEGMHRSFIANVSHELKTPMTTIAGFIDGILDGTIPENQQKKYLKIVSDEVKRLSRLVRSMLELSRIDSGEMKLNPTRFDITKTVFSTLLTFEQKIDDRNIEIRGLDAVSPQKVLGDEDLIHQVIYNLIENAVKFTNDGGYILIKVVDSIDRTCVVIENSGQGIDPDDLPMIFGRFYKTDKSRSRDKNGMGLGLFIVKTVIKLHGGDIMAASKPGESTKFSFYIPKESSSADKKDGSKKEVLDAQIADDTITVCAQEIDESKSDGEKSDDR